MCNSPVLMSTLETNYRTLGPAKRIVKKNLSATVDNIENGTLSLEEVVADPCLKHVCKQISPYVHAPDPDVQRWATLALQIQRNSDILLLFSSMIQKLSQETQAIIRIALKMTLSECNRMNCPCLPYNEPQ